MTDWGASIPLAPLNYRAQTQRAGRSPLSLSVTGTRRFRLQ